MRWILIPLLLTLGALGCKDQEKIDLQRKAERQASQLRRTAEALDEARAGLEQVELNLSFLQAEARNPVQVHERTAAAREALRKVQLRLKEAEDGVKQTSRGAGSIADPAGAS